MYALRKLSPSLLLVLAVGCTSSEPSTENDTDTDTNANGSDTTHTTGGSNASGTTVSGSNSGAPSSTTGSANTTTAAGGDGGSGGSGGSGGATVGGSTTDASASAGGSGGGGANTGTGTGTSTGGTVADPGCGSHKWACWPMPNMVGSGLPNEASYTINDDGSVLPPDPLRYEVHGHGNESYVFASALLFRFEGLHSRALPLFRISYPQLSLRLYVTDGDGIPAVLFSRVVVPYWVVPLSRLFGRQPAQGGFFSYPDPSTDTAASAAGPDDVGGNGDGSARGTVTPDGEWLWSLRRRGKLEVRGRVAAPRLGPGPDLGGWQRTVDYVRRRPVGYVHWDGRLRSLRKSHQPVPVWPLAVEMDATGMLQSSFPRVDASVWTRPHSAWLCPEIPFTFEVGRPKLLSALPARRRVATPVADGC